jgi:hypothetical protein
MASASASETISTPKMIVQYEWILENVEEELTSIASKMILFRGERVFRVGLKKTDEFPFLFLMAIDLNKMGMKVRNVTYGIQGSSSIGPTKMKKMIKEEVGDDESLQLFTFVKPFTVAEEVVGNCTFVFRICIIGADHGLFSYQLSDRLAKDQLWAALNNQQNLADVELIVKDKTFFAHAAILASRSRVFAAEFKKIKPVKDVTYQIWIDGVEPSTVENFLHFIYTGEPMGTLADEELLKLADHYQLTTLSSLCKLALKKIGALQMAKVRQRLNRNAEELSSSKIMYDIFLSIFIDQHARIFVSLICIPLTFPLIIRRPEKETEIFFDRTTPTFRCNSLLDPSRTGKSKCVMQYQNENICIASLIGKRQMLPGDGFHTYIDPVIHLSCAKHRSFGLQLEDVYCNLQEVKNNYSNLREHNQWLKMESKNVQKNAELLHFAAQTNWQLSRECYHPVNFDIKFISTIGNYYYEMMDDLWLKNFWAAATNKKFTDVDIFVGTVKVMEAHRVILSARSPILHESLNKISNTGKSIVTFGAEFDVETVKHFLNFLYTGSLKTNTSKQLRKLAKVYDVETLKNVCQLINASLPDVEELTNCLI